MDGCSPHVSMYLYIHTDLYAKRGLGVIVPWEAVGWEGHSKGGMQRRTNVDDPDVQCIQFSIVKPLVIQLFV